MKKILIVSYRFAPENRIGARRPTKVAKYLARAGYSVVVVTRAHGPASRGPEEIEGVLLDRVHRLAHSSRHEKFVAWKEAAVRKKHLSRAPVQAGNPSRPPAKKSTLGALASFAFRQFCDLYSSLDFYRAFRREVKANPALARECDRVLTSYGPLGSLLCGMYLKTRFRARWVCDFRDPLTHNIPFGPWWLLLFLTQKAACAKADRIITVSHGLRRTICGRRYTRKSAVIHNGFDPEDSGEIIAEKIPSRHFLAYAGTVYPERQKFAALIEALGALVRENILPPGEKTFHYAGAYYREISREFFAHGLLESIENHGFLERRDCLHLQLSSHSLVLASWNSRREQGILTGKLFEYIQLGKPIVALVGGDTPGSELAAMVRRGNLGVAYEAANHDKDFPALLDFLRRQYRCFAAGLEPEYNPDREYVARFDYRNIARSFEKVIAGVK